MDIIVIVVTILFLLFLLVNFWGRPFYKGLPVLVYHKVTNTKSPNFLTVTTSQIIEQFEYLKKNGYTTIFMSELLAHLEKGTELPEKPVMLTFDDGHKNNYTNLYPLLERYNMKVNIFLVANFIRHEAEENSTNAMGEFMTVEEVLSMNKSHVQFGLHSFDHKNYKELALSSVNEDIVKAKQRLESLSIPFQPCMAYTFGIYTRRETSEQNTFFEVLENNNIRLAFRVGNRSNKIRIQGKDQFMIGRINISGLFPLWKFKIALWGFIKIVENKALFSATKNPDRSDKNPSFL